MQRARLDSGIELDYIDCGPCDAHTLIFLHGFPESHRAWRNQVSYFSDRFRCIAPDQRGYCGSSKPQSISDYTIDKLTKDVFELAQALGLESFTVVGHDWGGAVAYGVAMQGQASGKIANLITINAPTPYKFQKLLWLDPAQREASQYMREFCNSANDEIIRTNGLGELLLNSVKWLRHDKLEVSERNRQLLQWQDGNAAISMLNWYRAASVVVPPMDAPFALPIDWVEPILPTITIPTLVIWGMEDNSLLSSNLDGLSDITTDLTIHKVLNHSHFLPWEDPDTINNVMASFLAKLF